MSCYSKSPRVGHSKSDHRQQHAPTRIDGRSVRLGSLEFLNQSEEKIGELFHTLPARRDAAQRFVGCIVG